METKDEIQRLFAKTLREDDQILKLQDKLVKGTATYKQSEQYAALVGKAYSEAFKAVVGPAETVGGDLYFQIAQEVFPPGLHSIYQSTANYVMRVQELQNKAAGIGLKALIPEYGDIQTGYLQKLADSVTPAGLEHAVDTEPSFFARRVVDEAIRMNAEAHERAGLEVTVTRIYGDKGVHNGKDPCKWCISRCGNAMSLQEALDKDAFSTHQGCACTIIYTSAKGKTTKRVGGGWWQEV